ncbi:MAG: acylneuraminate cytidylyltransferase family protein [Elusimicrobia bacterium]|nr:acylneuraminate cytidylyltransferase family protein [Elusimicrobiota bacterium]
MTGTILGFIPARKGSKGLPGKNARLLGGMPLVAHTIRAGLTSKCLDRLLVSTDSPAIARIAKDHGAEAPWLRPAKLSTDRAAVVDAVLDALERLEKKGYSPQAVLLLQPTSPLRLPRTIKKAVELFRKSGGESVLSVVPAQDHPQWCYKVKDGVLSPFLPPRPPAPRQALEPAYVLDGSIYLATVETLKSRRSFRSLKPKALLIAPEESLDIDTQEDWDEAKRRLGL